VCRTTLLAESLEVVEGEMSRFLHSSRDREIWGIIDGNCCDSAAFSRLLINRSVSLVREAMATRSGGNVSVLFQ